MGVMWLNSNADPDMHITDPIVSAHNVRSCQMNRKEKLVADFPVRKAIGCAKLQNPVPIDKC